MKCVVCGDKAVFIVNNKNMCKHCFGWGIVTYDGKGLVITTSKMPEVMK